MRLTTPLMNELTSPVQYLGWEIKHSHWVILVSGLLNYFNLAMNKIIGCPFTFTSYILTNLFREPIDSPRRLSSGLDSIER